MHTGAVALLVLSYFANASTTSRELCCCVVEEGSAYIVEKAGAVPDITVCISACTAVAMDLTSCWSSTVWALMCVA